MGLRIHRSWTIIPGLRLNLSKSGFGLSIGAPPFVFSVGPRGSRQTISLPGSGLSWVTTQGRRHRMPKGKC
jgi:hypothetical protein